MLGLGLRLGLRLGFYVEVEVDATLNFRHSLDGVQILFRWLGGWGWLENGD